MNEKLKISRIFHAGYVFECDGKSIAFDPVFENPLSRNGYAFPSIEFDYDRIRQLKFSAVFISHYHDDHCSMESLAFLDRATPIYMYCVYDEMFEMIKALGFTKVASLELNQSVRLESFTVTPRIAVDAAVDCIFQIEAASLKILNVVDSWIDENTIKKLSAFAPWDMVLWPFQTMREVEVLSPHRFSKKPAGIPEEWWEQLRKLQPRYVVPSSCQLKQEDWSWYNQAFYPISYRQFASELGQTIPGAEIVRMNPGVSVVLDKNSMKFDSPLRWIRPVGYQEVDYEYDENIKIPSTSEISKHFPALSDKEAARVKRFCVIELPEKHLNEMAQSYFNSPRNWQLRVYDHAGYSLIFNYKITHHKIAFSDFEEPDWLTEVPMARLYGALENGETLTSMYLRINDMRFSDAIEAELQDVDVLEDPLVQSLFNGTFGAYQAAQLRRILKASAG